MAQAWQSFFSVCLSYYEREFGGAIGIHDSSFSLSCARSATDHLKWLGAKAKKTRSLSGQEKINFLVSNSTASLRQPEKEEQQFLPHAHIHGYHLETRWKNFQSAQSSSRIHGLTASSYWPNGPENQPFFFVSFLFFCQGRRIIIMRNFVLFSMHPSIYSLLPLMLSCPITGMACPSICISLSASKKIASRSNLCERFFLPE